MPEACAALRVSARRQSSLLGPLHDDDAALRRVEVPLGRGAEVLGGADDVLELTTCQAAAPYTARQMAQRSRGGITNVNGVACRSSRARSLSSVMKERSASNGPSRTDRQASA